MAANQNEMGLPGEVSHGRLVQQLAVGREQHHVGVGRPQLFDRLKNRAGLHHHPGPAAKRGVIGRVVAVVGPVAQVTDVDLDDVSIGGAADDARVERTRKHLGKERQDVDAHLRRHCPR